MNLLSFFRETNEAVEMVPAGMYVVPTFCEYCGAPETTLCHAETCPRPRLFFAKKRPPFCQRNAQVWDETTDDYIDDNNNNNKAIEDNTAPSSKKSWTSSFFG